MTHCRHVLVFHSVQLFASTLLFVFYFLNFISSLHFLLILCVNSSFSICFSYPHISFLSLDHFVLLFGAFVPFHPLVLFMHCPLFFFELILPFCSSSPPVSICSSALLFSLFTSADNTTHSFIPLPLQSTEVETMGAFCLKLSYQLLNSGNKQYYTRLAFPPNQGCLRLEVGPLVDGA